MYRQHPILFYYMQYKIPNNKMQYCFYCGVISNLTFNLAVTVLRSSSFRSNMAIFGIEVKVKVTRSLTLVSFERVQLVEYAFQK